MTTTGKADEGEEVGEEEEEDEKWKSCRFFLVGNIPAKFRSSDLRAFFSQFVEKEYFVCFHYRHRPEQLHAQPDHSNTELRREASDRLSTGVDLGTSHSHQSDTQRTALEEGEAKTKCCVVAMSSGRSGGVGKFVQMYGNKNWSTADGGLLRQRVRITELKVDISGGHSSPTQGNRYCTALSTHK